MNSRRQPSKRRIEEEEEEESSESSSASESESDNSDETDSDDQNDESEFGGKETVESQGNKLADPEAKVSEGTKAEAGIMKKLFLRNFMCHSQLEVNLGEIVNFIVGRNGSGKSAILTAITVVLGGKAAITNRGGSLKELIKKGCSTAEITLTLKNEGEEAHKPDEYGNRIQIIRRITKDSGSSYIIKGEKGVVSKKKEELTAICDRFEIQVDNPVQILNQDTSRQFLNSATAKDKYAFFMKATNLEALDNDYNFINNQKNMINSSVKRKGQALKQMKIEVREWKEKYESVQGIQRMKDELTRIEQEYLWTYVGEAEGSLKRLGDEKSMLREIREKTLLELEALRKEFDILKDDQTACEERAQLKSQQAEDVRKDGEATEAQLKSLRQQHKTFEQNIAKNRKMKTEHEREKQKVERSIEELRQKAERDIASENEVISQKINKLKQDKHAFFTRMDALKKKVGEGENELKEVEARKDAIQKERRNVNAQADVLTKKVEELKRNNNSVSVFGPEHVAILKEVQKHQSKFTRKPVGPLGQEIKLLRPEWAQAVEVCLGEQLMSAYAVTCKEDELVLIRIMKALRIERKPMIMTRKFDDPRHNVPGNQCQDFPRVLDVIQCDNSAVFNLVIDSAKPETQLLFEDNKVGYDFLFPKQGRQRQGNYITGFTKIGEKLIGGTSYQHIWPQNRNFTRKLGADVASQIASYQRQHQEKKAEISSMAGEYDKIGSDRTKLFANLKQLKGHINDIQKKLNRTESELEGLTLAEKEDVSNAVACFEGEVEEYQRKIGTCSETILTLESEKLSNEEKIEPLRKQADAVKRKQEKMLALAAEEVKRVDTIASKIANKGKNIQSSEGKSEQIKARLEEMEKELDAMKQEVDDRTEKAMAKYPERVSSKKSSAELGRQYASHEKTIEREENNRGNVDEIAYRYRAKNQSYQDSKEACQNLNSYVDKLEKALQKRRDAFKQYQKYIALRAKYYFSMTLSQRGYSGSMRFDHEQKTLQLDVNINEKAEAANQRSKNSEKNKENDSSRKNKRAKLTVGTTKTLSGGERSFSTISFIMSLWEAMECPFRVLDEFDVFMDAVNRRASMAMLIKCAVTTRNRQYVFITPQDSSGLAQSDVKVIKLRDPERDQTTLQFRPAPMAAQV
eukprot:Nk52_evm8s155 gene=Nk52_evmTU8s155